MKVNLISVSKLDQCRDNRIIFFVTLFFALLGTAKYSCAVESICPGGSSPSPNILFCEDWETGIPTGGWPNTSGSVFNGWTTGNYMGSEGLSELSTSIFHSGSRSLHVTKKGDENFVKDQLRSFASTTEIRMRFWIYFASNYSNYGTDDNNVHLIFTQTGLSYHGIRLDLVPYTNKTGTPVENLIYAWPPTCSSVNQGARGNIVISSPGGSVDTYKGITQGRSELCWSPLNTLGSWHKVEWAAKIVSENETRASLWIDDTQLMSDELLMTDSSYLNFDNIIISGYMSQLKDFALDYYIDDIVFSNDYDVYIGGDTIPPFIPQGLTVD